MPDKDHLFGKLAALERRAREGDAKAVEKQHGEKKLTARERVEQLLDAHSFVEEFMLAATQVVDFGMAEKREPGDGVVTGFGKIDGRPVYVFAQDRAVLAGTVGSAHAEKIAYAIQTARSSPPSCARASASPPTRPRSPTLSSWSRARARCSSPGPPSSKKCWASKSRWKSSAARRSIPRSPASP